MIKNFTQTKMILLHGSSVYRKKDNTNYWTQWTAKDNVKVLLAYDPEANKAVEILQVSEK